MQRRDRTPTPLVFLNGGLSPYALSRDQSFVAEDVPGEALSGRTYDPILHHLPFAVIGVPWYQLAHLPDIPVVAHETGHTVEQAFQLHGLINQNLEAGLGAGSARLAEWQAWSREGYADLWGCLTLGPAYASSLIDFLAADPRIIENELSSTNAKYPSAYLRVLIACKALDVLGFDDDAETLVSAWGVKYAKHAMSAFEADVDAVVDACLGKPLARPGLKQPLKDIATLRFGTHEWQWAKDGARAGHRHGQAHEPHRHDPPLGGCCPLSVRSFARALRVANGHGNVLLKNVKTLIQPGVRAGEPVATSQDKDDIFHLAMQCGREQFRSFAAWVNVPLST